MGYNNQIAKWCTHPHEIKWLVREQKRISQYEECELRTNDQGQKALFYTKGFWQSEGPNNDLKWHENKHKSNN